jgi:hypothetical protein
MIHDDFSFNEPFSWRDPGASLRSMGLIKQLRTLEEAIRDNVTDLETDQESDRELIMKEKALLEITQKEIQRLERKTLDEELGQD